tara:strand:- start:77 stop:358 length:282 start_codon:yes stop_codon:yes gene_type:complete
MSTPTPRTDAKLLTVAQRTSPNYLPEMVWAHFARTLERELAAERARLDWMEDSSRCYHVCISRQPNGRSMHNMAPSAGSVRSAIDAAMKEDAK